MIYTFQYNHHDYMLYLWVTSPRVSRSCFYTRDVKSHNVKKHVTQKSYFAKEKTSLGDINLLHITYLFKQ